MTNLLINRWIVEEHLLMRITEQTGCHEKLLMPPYDKTIVSADRYLPRSNTRGHGTNGWLNQIWYRVRYGDGSETIRARKKMF
jgi:hypothetical protein